MEGSKKILIGVGIAFGILAFLLIIYFMAVSSMVVFLVFSVVNVLSIVIFAVYIIQTRRESRKKGLPVQDEMSKNIAFTAGYYAWHVSMYSAVLIMFVNIAAEETGSYYIQVDTVIPVLIIVPGLVWVLLIQYFRARGIDA